MQTFAEQLNTVRKERKLTQEQLAQELNVSRTTISRWEKGVMMPDLDTVKQLSQVLEYNFFTTPSVEPAAESASPDAATPVQPEQQPAPQPRKRKFLLPAVLGALLLCAVLAIVLVPNNASHMQALVAITPTEDPVRAIRFEEFPDGVGWFYEFRMEETAGVPFTIHELTVVNIGDNGQEYPQSYTADQISQWWDSNTLQQSESRFLSGGFPLQDVKGVNLILTGTDANGHELTFEGSLTLSKEIAE